MLPNQNGHFDRSIELKRHFVKNVAVEYLMYLDFGTVLTLHSFVTSFFLLWSYASNTLYDELLAAKFLHCVFPILAAKWWFMATYPSHQSRVLKMLRVGDFTMEDREKTIELEKLFKTNDLLVLTTLIKITLLFLTLIVLDVVYACVRLVPIMYRCGSRDNDGSGNVPIECGGDGLVDAYPRRPHEFGDRRLHRDTNWSLHHYGISYLIVTIATALHIFVGIAVIVVCWKLRINVHKYKSPIYFAFISKV